MLLLFQIRLPSKFWNWIRIQSDHLPTIGAILEALVQRIDKHTQPKVRIVNSSPLPIMSLIALVDAHFKSYQSLQIIRVSNLDFFWFINMQLQRYYFHLWFICNKLQEKLKNCTIRMRLLERRYFTKLDDKKTGSIDSIMTFLKTTHHELMTHIQSLENAKQHLSK